MYVLGTIKIRSQYALGTIKIVHNTLISALGMIKMLSQYDHVRSPYDQDTFTIRFCTLSARSRYVHNTLMYALGTIKIVHNTLIYALGRSRYVHNTLMYALGMIKIRSQYAYVRSR